MENKNNQNSPQKRKNGIIKKIYGILYQSIGVLSCKLKKGTEDEIDEEEGKDITPSQEAEPMI